MTILERICRHAKNRPDKPAVIFEDSIITYGELWEDACRFAKVLSDLGVRQGDRVIVQAFYSKWFIAACFGCHLANAVFVPAEKNSNTTMIRGLYEGVDAALFIGLFRALECNTLLYAEMEQKISAAAPEWDGEFLSEDRIADLMFTTGTTGVPKGVMVSYKNIVQTVLTRIAEINVRENNVAITLIPLNHVAPMRELYLNGYVGGSVILLDGITKMKKMFAMMDEYNVTSMYLPPANISILQQMSKERLRTFSDRIDYVYTGSAPMQEAQQEYMRTMLPNSRLYFSYGSSENGTVCLLRYDRDQKDIRCVGRPCVGVDVKLLADDNTEAKTGQLGVVSIKSEMNMPGYWNREDLNKEVFQNGYFISNDVGFFDDSGFLYITGRKDDIINIGGLKVYPSEIENAALSVPGIQDCVCFSVPDRITGQAAKLLIQTGDEFVGDLRTIHDELAHLLDGYKIPKVIEFVDSIKRTSNGKVDRKFYQNS